MQTNLANTYDKLERREEALQIKWDVYFGRFKLHGAEHEATILAANNVAVSLAISMRFKEARVLLRKMIPVARRVLGDSNAITLKMRWTYAGALYEDDDATLDDLREAVMRIEETEWVTRRVLGGAHPLTVAMEESLRRSRAALAAREKSRETPSVGA